MDMYKINEFNEILIGLINDVAYVCPKSIIGQNKGLLINTIRTTRQKERFIEIFMTKIAAPYKEYIDKRDDRFFLNKDYNDEVEGDKSIIDYIFKMKDVWKDMRKENKAKVWDYMDILCEMSLDHYIKYYQ